MEYPIFEISNNVFFEKEIKQSFNEIIHHQSKFNKCKKSLQLTSTCIITAIYLDKTSKENNN
jgi:hypothetical protein